MFCDVMLNDKVWSSFYLNHGSRYFISYRLEITKKISFVELGKQCGELYLVCKKIITPALISLCGRAVGR